MYTKHYKEMQIAHKDLNNFEEAQSVHKETQNNFKKMQND